MCWAHCGLADRIRLIRRDRASWPSNYSTSECRWHFNVQVNCSTEKPEASSFSSLNLRLSRANCRLHFFMLGACPLAPHLNFSPIIKRTPTLHSQPFQPSGIQQLVFRLLFLYCCLRALRFHSDLSPPTRSLDQVADFAPSVLESNLLTRIRVTLSTTEGGLRCWQGLRITDHHCPLAISRVYIEHIPLNISHRARYISPLSFCINLHGISFVDSRLTFVFDIVSCTPSFLSSSL